MDQRDRRDDERVLAAEKLDEALLDLRIEHRTPEHPRPARMCPPLLEVLGDRGDHLAVEVEAEVVAGGEVGQPLVADANHPAVDLVDDSVRHRVRPLELGQLAARREPAIDPSRRRGWSSVTLSTIVGRSFLGNRVGRVATGVTASSPTSGRVLLFLRITYAPQLRGPQSAVQINGAFRSARTLPSKGGSSRSLLRGVDA